MWKNLARGTLALHVAFSLFVILMPFLVPLGAWLSWEWTRGSWLRHIHMAIFVFIAVEVMLSKPCPFTVWEDRCRIRAGMQPRYAKGFFDFWIEHLIKIPFKDWMFESVLILLGISSILEYFFLGPFNSSP